MTRKDRRAERERKGFDEKFNKLFLQMDGRLWELAIHLYFNILFLFLGSWLPKPPLMLEGIWELLPHDRKNLLVNPVKPHLLEGIPCIQNSLTRVDSFWSMRYNNLINWKESLMCNQ
jgi:hypothetical protein